MRVVGGSAKGKKLLAVPGNTTRPILDRVKTALFDVLRPSLIDLTVLDLFAGAGSVGIEALSQGAKFCTFIDLESKAIEVIKKNLAHTNLLKQSEVRCTDAYRFIKSSSKSYDLIYIAPPQYQGIWIEILQLIAGKPSILNPAGRIIVQIDPKEYEIFHSNIIRETQRRNYGNSDLVFYSLY